MTIEGLFPNARKRFNMKDDRMTFIYLEDGCLYNYDQVFEYFIYEGAYYYPMAIMYTQSGSAYGGMLGLMGGYVADGIFAIVDSGKFASYNEVCDGFALLAYNDMSHTVYTGLLEIVTELLLIRPDVDDALIAENGAIVREEKKDEATVSTSQFNSFADIIVRGPMNMVESFAGFLQSSVEQARSGKYCRNYLDMNNLKITSDFQMKAASYDAEIR